MKKGWTEKEIAIAVEELKNHTTLEEACKAISDKVGFLVNPDSLRGAFQRHKQPSAGSFLRAKTLSRDTAPHVPPDRPEEPPKHLLEERAEKEAEARQKKQFEAVLDELHNLRVRQSFIDNLNAFRAPPRILPRERSGKVREMTAVVLASDWHVEEPVEPESVMGRNKYNLEIADQRVERFFQSIIWNVEHQRASGRIAIRDLVLWLGGDLMSGYIHEELLESNLLSPTETVRWLIPRLRNGIATLQERLALDHIEIPCSFGNHGRTTAKPRISTAYANSFEWLMYHQLADEFRNNPGIHFEITQAAHQYVQVYDWMLHFHHGDDVKYQGGVGGLGIPLLKAVPMWDMVKHADVHNIGHWHQLRDYGHAVVNGSLIGYGPFSLRIRASFEEPQQAMYYMDSVRGKTMLTPLWVSEEAPQHGGR